MKASSKAGGSLFSRPFSVKVLFVLRHQTQLPGHQPGNHEVPGLVPGLIQLIKGLYSLTSIIKDLQQ